MYAEHDAEHARRYDAHELEIHLPNKRSGIHGRCKSAENTDLVSKIWSLLFS